MPLDAHALDGAVRHHEAIRANEPIQRPVDLIRTAPVVAVHQCDFRRKLSGLGYFVPALKTDDVFLKIHPAFQPHSLLLHFHRCPAFLTHTANDLSRGQERIACRYSRLRSGGKHARSLGPDLFVVQLDAGQRTVTAIDDGIEHVIFPFLAVVVMGGSRAPARFGHLGAGRFAGFLGKPQKIPKLTVGALQE
jgi:hypothetical protein